jgi:hypothetical protein
MLPFRLEASGATIEGADEQRRNCLDPMPVCANLFVVNKRRQ